MTEKLYEKDGSIYVFEATVLSCEPTQNGFAVTLDRTAFFPGGGGQACDVGSLAGVSVTGASLDGTVPAGTFDCIVVRERKIERGIGRNRDTLTENWYAPGIGPVRHDSYNYNNGNPTFGAREVLKKY